MPKDDDSLLHEQDHNKGQEDASEGVYDRPYSTSSEVVDFFNPFVSSNDFERSQERNEDYDQGWNHTYNQK